MPLPPRILPRECIVAISLLVGVCAFAPSAKAQTERPPAPASISTGPLAPNGIFVRDAHDPRVLHKTPEAAAQGFNREIMQALSRPRISDETMDLLYDVTGDQPSLPIEEVMATGPGANAITVLDGNIIVMEGDDGLVVNTANGPMFDHQGNGSINAVLNAVWSAFGDQFDFITIWTTFDDPGAAGYYYPIQNDITGLGNCNFPVDTHGCMFNTFNTDTQLSGFVFMNSVSYWEDWDYNYSGKTYALTDPKSFIYAVLAQEITHKWLAALRFVDPVTNAVNSQLLGRDRSHWASWVDTRASVQDGWSWEPLEDGGFRATGLMNGFSTLDLYAMGSLPSNAAEPFYYIENAILRPVPGFFAQQPLPAEAALQLYDPTFLAEYDYYIDVDGTRVDLTIDDVVQAEGVRCPDVDHAQKSFRQAVVLVTAPGQSASSVGARVTELETAMETWEGWFNDKTRGALTICTDAEEACTHPRVEVTAVTQRPNDIVAGDEVEITVQVEVLEGTATDIVVTGQLVGDDAEYAELVQGTALLGSLGGSMGGVGQLKVQINDDAPCGADIELRITVKPQNGEEQTGTVFIRPGARAVYFADFDANEAEYEFDGSDAIYGAFGYENHLQANCEITSVSPTRDASAAGRGAIITNPTTMLAGETSTTSPVIDLDGANTPTLTFAAWVAGGAELDVQVAPDGGDFVSVHTVTVEEGNGAYWSRQVVDLDDALGETPDEIQLRFVGSGTDVEVAIDEVNVWGATGECIVVAAEPEPEGDGDGDGCSCTASDAAAPYAGLSALLLAGFLTRRRRRTRRA